MKKLLALLLALLCAVGVSASTLNGRILGDTNGDGVVNIDDALLLFQNSILPDVYHIDYPGTLDVTKDGKTDIDDALLLFQYSMLPDVYPIEWGVTPDVPHPETVTYEDYIAMGDSEQQAFIASFDTLSDFFAWLANAKAEYDENNPGHEIGGDGGIDLGGGN
ncbi:MAG: hypothetical protein E7638_06325 [Ruminococcaceae bacterium]|nr:hypothetical protein [Oscillospiraceae bacterium]